MSEGVTWMAFWGRLAGDAQCLPFTSSSLIWGLQNMFVTWRTLGYNGHAGHTVDIGNTFLIVGEERHGVAAGVGSAHSWPITGRRGTATSATATSGHPGRRKPLNVTLLEGSTLFHDLDLTPPATLHSRDRPASTPIQTTIRHIVAYKH